MATISAADIARLRRMTLAGMMDCKKALEEAEGNFEKAVEIIRKKGQSVASKRADREASEGVVLARISDDGKTGMMIVLNSESDFVAKNAEFIGFANQILDLAMKNNPADLEGLKSLTMDGVSVGEKVVEYIGIIGEKMELSQFYRIEAPFVQAYIHPGNKLAAIAGFDRSGLDQQIYKDIVMQVAAMNPVAIDKADVPQSVIDQELEIGKEQAKREGKPEAMLDKIAQGKLGKFFKENTLLNQDFIKDSKITVGQYLKTTGDSLKVTGFERHSLSN
jgi:elongation factor Ts